MPTLRITNGQLVDPAQQLDRARQDLYIRDGRIIAPPADGHVDETLDANGGIIMAGAIDMHAHIASGSVNAARQIQSATGYPTGQPPVVPTAPDTGRLYASLGYTTGIEAAVPPAAARLTHHQLDDLPHLDTGMLLLLANHEALVQRLDANDRPGAIAIVHHLLQQTRALGIKAVNPAAVAIWRRDPKQRGIHDIDQSAPNCAATTRTMLELLTEAAEHLDLAHPTHIHGPKLGQPGAIDITLDMLRAISGRRCHLAHLQYYCYAATEKGQHLSAAAAMADYLRDHPEVTADLGQVTFGPAFTATSDTPLEYGLWKHAGSPARPAFFNQRENEDCFGVMPLEHSPSNPIHAVMWATGLELALTLDDHRQLSLTVDHPNGGSFTRYPNLIAMLMSKARRDAALDQCHRFAREHTGLAQIDRELTLTEIATLTRTAPAQALGLKDKGHLTPNQAVADIAIYPDNLADPEAMFANPTHVFRAGQLTHTTDSATSSTADTKPNRLTAPLPPNDDGANQFNHWLEDTRASYTPKDVPA